MLNCVFILIENFSVYFINTLFGFRNQDYTRFQELILFKLRVTVDSKSEATWITFYYSRHGINVQLIVNEIRYRNILMFFIFYILVTFVYIPYVKAKI